MKQTISILILLCLATSFGFVDNAKGQQPIQYLRPHDQTGLNVFETDKSDTTSFKSTSVHIGGAFVQDWQSLTDHNYTNPQSKTLSKADSANLLAPLGGGFQLGFANLYLDAQLADGIRTEVTLYLATVHHEDTWVKNGYLQIDKMLFLNSDIVNNIMQYVTIQAGALEVDYGDQHFRRVDGGNGMDDPFIENYIMDEFATEVGAEFYYHNNGWLAMAGVTDAQLNPQIKQSSTVDSLTHQVNVYDPSFLAKLGYDKQVNSDLRVRLTGSYYEVQSTQSSTLFGGDRAGSHYNLVMANTAAPVSNPTNSAEDNTFTQGRFNPGFSEAVNTFMINPFIKFDGLEFFGTYEDANGRAISETANRNATQMAAELIYRFGSTQQFWVGGRYNTVKAQLAPVSANIPDVTINRIEASLGWFLIPSVMMKVEYVNQQYENFPVGNILYGGPGMNAGFQGVVAEAAVGF
jgi:hypothetical protein